MESVECPSCHRAFDDSTLLSLHHEYEPCFKSISSPSKTSLICPMCDNIFYDPLVLQIHVNEDHDQISAHTTTTTTATSSDSLYAQELERREQMKRKYDHQQHTACATSYEQFSEDEDARIARLLQEEENAQSFEEFQV